VNFAEGAANALAASMGKTAVQTISVRFMIGTPIQKDEVPVRKVTDKEIKNRPSATPYSNAGQKSQLKEPFLGWLTFKILAFLY